ncbi:hypothetical protein LCGC14_0929790 [marine sediment metagenome]|uniref:Uncharacterized protein n=1 Tax=marine sediment metagenome TaxID=412755 RepID=A0A0F9RUX7_9ZZZZ
MVMQRSGMVQKGPFGRVPSEASAAGDQKKNEFVAALLNILGDCRFLWLPKSSETTTSTDLTKNAATITYDATFAGKYSRVGSGLFATLDGTADEGDIPDSALYTFGDSTNDEPMFVIALVEPTDTTPTAATTIISKWNKDTDAELREWRFYLSATNGYPTLELLDETNNGFIGRQDQTALSSGKHLICGTYSGSGISSGVNIFVDAVDLDDADSESGSYTAMNDTAAVVSLGHTLSAASSPVAEEFWAGGFGLVAVGGGALSAEDMWAIKELCNGFFDLSI